MLRFSTEAYDAFTDAIKAVERRARTIAILSLSINLPEAKSRENLESAISAFIEREMSWLATVQDLRAVANEILAVATATATEENRERLVHLRQRAQAAATRMALIKRLPPSPELAALDAAAGVLVGTLAPGQRDVFALRAAELQAELAVTEEFSAARVAAFDSHAQALRLLSLVSSRVDETVNMTRLRIDWAERIIAGFAVLAAIGGLLILRRYVTQNLLARLHALKT